MDTFGIPPRQWDAAKTQAREAMIARAKLGGVLPYSELVAKIQAVQFEPHDVRLFALLGEISAEEDAANRGMLSAVVVHKGDGQPGPGFFDLAQKLGRDTTAILPCWVSELKKVHAHWSV